MSSPQPVCPACESTRTVKNGKIHNGKQNFKCRECGRQFVQDPQNKIIDPATKILMDKLLLEKIPLAGIARLTGVSEHWLQSYVNAKYQAVPRHIEVSAKKGALDDPVWRDMVVCRKQGQQAVDLVGLRCRDPRNCWRIRWEPQSGGGTRMMEC